MSEMCQTVWCRASSEHAEAAREVCSTVDIGFGTNAALQEKVSFVLFEFVFFAQKN